MLIAGSTVSFIAARERQRAGNVGIPRSRPGYLRRGQCGTGFGALRAATFSGGCRKINFAQHDSHDSRRQVLWPGCWPTRSKLRKHFRDSHANDAVDSMLFERRMVTRLLSPLELEE